MARETSAAPDITGPDRPELRKAIDEIVESGFVGVSLRVHDERGGWVGTAGAAELGGTAPPPADGHVRIGSNTKTFTATVALQLVAEDRLGLDDPAADHLPGYGLDGRITVRMLLQHTSGLFNVTGEVGEDGTVEPGIPVPYGPRGREWVDDRFRAHRPEDLVRLALSRPARFEPGLGWSYSNTNYLLVRLLVERVTGRPFAEELRRRILAPLDLAGTLVPDGPELPAPHAHAYYRYGDAGTRQTVDITRHDPSWVAGGGDMISTTRDLRTFIAALTGGTLLPAPQLAEMFRPEGRAGYGLGVFVQQTPRGGTVITHNGGMAGYATLMYGSPDGSRTLTAALNCVDDADLSIAAAFQSAQQRLVDEVFRPHGAG